MRFLMVAVGDRMPGWIDAGFADYARRMPRTTRLELVEVRPEPRKATRTAEQCMVAEAARIDAAIPAGVRRVVLDERGRDLTTAALAEQMTRWLAGSSDVAFIIGGPDGLDPALKRSAEMSLRLSSMTLPHALVRVLLAEQLYRASSILNHHPYHRE
jgi:23S rRNA (pseudouridine1915-N3)-methyltransferase